MSWRISGCEAAVSRSRSKFERDRDSINEPLYRGVFSKVHDMKQKKTAKEAEPGSADCEDAVGDEAAAPRWQKEGLEDDENSAAYTARNIGHSEMGRRRTPREPVTRTYDSKGITQARLCTGGFCNKEGKKCKLTAQQRTRKQVAEKKRESRTRTTGLCWCGVCTDDVGVEAAVSLCHFCFSVPEAHEQAGDTVRTKKTVSGKKKSTKPIVWAPGRKPSEPS